MNATNRLNVSIRNANIVRRLATDLETNPPASGLVAVTPAQFKAMSATYHAIVASGAPIPEFAKATAKKMGII